MNDRRIPQWTALDWLFAAIIPGAFFAFEALAVVSFPILRAPNVGLLQQIGLWLLFFGLWVLVPRTIWLLTPQNRLEIGSREWREALLRLTLLGCGLGAAHLALLAGILRTMHAPPGGQLHDFLSSYAETLLGRAPIWLLAFGIAAFVIALVKPQRAKPAEPPSRIELRDRGRTRLVELHEIVWIKASGNYVEYHLLDGVVLARQSLRSVRATLGEDIFIPSHRSALVNRSHVKAIRAGGPDEAYRAVMANGDEAPLSRRHLSRFRDAMAGGKNGDLTARTQ
ncbi:MAG: LytTR family DNA-binding domain-containing protein [Erythrobacter sp.]|nr:LytTR family DNA-binding domain-containing protein [Erythrobacter sp.]